MDKEKRVQTGEASSAPSTSNAQVRSFDSKPSIMGKKSIILFIVVVILGVITGFGVAQIPFGGGASSDRADSVAEGKYKKGDLIGSSEKAFKDSAEGKLEKGGVEGEGAYHLVRPGGDSQNVYLTSSVIDLSPLVGRRIKVWGQTNDAQVAGWLMDVGRVEILN